MSIFLPFWHQAVELRRGDDGAVNRLQCLADTTPSSHAVGDGWPKHAPELAKNQNQSPTTVPFSADSAMCLGLTPQARN